MFQIVGFKFYTEYFVNSPKPAIRRFGEFFHKHVAGIFFTVLFQSGKFFRDRKFRHNRRGIKFEILYLFNNDICIVESFRDIGK